MLIRRNIVNGDLAYFTTWCPAGTSIQTLVSVEGHRWAIEDSFETAKNEFGLDHNESRSWHGWHRHVSLVMLAFAMMAAIQHQANKPAPKKSRAQRQDIRPHPLVDPGNPPHSPTSHAKTNSTRRHHRMVALAAGSSSRSTKNSSQTKITTVMLGQIGVPRSTFYRWYDQYQTGGPEALDDRSPRPDRVWNRIPDDVRSRVVTLALDEPELSPRELAVRFTDAERYFVSEASVYRLLKAHDLITSPAFITMKAADEFKNKTTAPNQLWQTDFTYLKVTGWGWFYLSTILDDFSRYIIAWKLCTTMKAEDVTDTLKLALQASGLDQATVMHRPRLLSDNGSSYVSGDLAKWLERQDMRHTRGAPYHPMTQGKIERWHQTLKNRILLENYYLPGDLEAQIDAFVAYYNHRRYHESIDNLTPADVYFGRSQTILLERERIKRKTIQNRRLLHHKQAA